MTTVPPPQPVAPWTLDRQERAVQTLAALDANVCSPERLLTWNDADQHRADAATVVYWMDRALRAEHNLAFDVAQAAAHALDLPLVVIVRHGRGADHTELRHLDVLLRGLPEMAATAARRGSHVLVVEGHGPTMPELCAGELRPALVIADDDVMTAARRRRARVAAALDVPLITVDADVVVPGACFPKQEYAARTLRPKLHRVLDQFIDELGLAVDARHGAAADHALPAQVLSMSGVHLGTNLPPIDDLLTRAHEWGVPDDAPLLADAPSGINAARTRLREFIELDLAGYALRRNKPELAGTSRISPFIRFGQISPHEVLAAVRDSGAPAEDIAVFVEEFVVRRELAYNFVRWNSNAHLLAGAPNWAQLTHAKHRHDSREWFWPEEDLTAGTTHDPLWNAAQRQMVRTGHMHGYVRMYWAKKLLEWHQDPAEAFDIALRLNDRWNIDGRDPNGITGVAWAIGGVHDRPWHEREIFGQIRYMSLASTGRKFRSKEYIERWT